MSAYNKVQWVQDFLLRTTDQQVGNQLPFKAPRYDTGGTPKYTKGLAIRRFGLQNFSSTDDLLVGIGFRWDNSTWMVGQWDDSDAASYTDDTADAQDTGAGDVVLFSATGEAATDGFVVLSKRPWSWLSINVSQPTTGNTTFAVDYSNAAGTGWTAAAAGDAWKSDFIISASVLGTGEKIWAWAPPPDWGKITSLENLRDGWYAWRCSIDANTVTQDGLATAIEVGSLLSVANVDSNGTFGMENCNFWDPDANALVGFISSVGSSERLTGYAEVEHKG